LPQQPLQLFVLGDVAHGGQYALKLSLWVVNCGSVAGQHGLPTAAALRRQLIIGHLALPQNQPDSFFRLLRTGEIALEWRAD
jgi:hypothetical protein